VEFKFAQKIVMEEVNVIMAFAHAYQGMMPRAFAPFATLDVLQKCAMDPRLKIAQLVKQASGYYLPLCYQVNVLVPMVNIFLGQFVWIVMIFA